MNIIEVKNLSKDYKYKVRNEEKGFLYNLFNEQEKVVKAVNNISFNVEEGETVAFIGPNGAGKSTTIKMLTGILYPTKGDIKICGLTPIKDRNKFHNWTSTEAMRGPNEVETKVLLTFVPHSFLKFQKNLTFGRRLFERGWDRSV